MHCIISPQMSENALISATCLCSATGQGCEAVGSHFLVASKYLWSAADNVDTLRLLDTVIKVILLRGFILKNQAVQIFFYVSAAEYETTKRYEFVNIFKNYRTKKISHLAHYIRSI